MKKIDLSLDYNKIIERINIDKSNFEPGVWATKIGVSINVVSNIHGKGKNVNPSLEYIIAVAQATGKPIEWYLYGIQAAQALTVASPEPLYKYMEHTAPYNADPCGEWSDEAILACEQVKRILDSNHPVIKPALLSNLAAFEYTIKQDEDIKKIQGEVAYLKKMHKKGRRTGTG